MWVILRGFEAVFWLTVAGFESDEESDLSDEDEIRISEDAWDLICRLICERENRIGAKAVTASSINDEIEEFRAHPFFEGVEWHSIRNRSAPFVPQLEGDADTSYFDVPNENKIILIDDAAQAAHFKGFTFKRTRPDSTVEISVSPTDALAATMF